MEKKDLKNSDLEKVSGGKKHSDGIKYSGTELIYCRYCAKETTQSLRVERGYKWDFAGRMHICDLYDCPECNNTNYYDQDKHLLIS